MNTALILSGGYGQRLELDIPKQYLIVSGKPILIYSLEKFEIAPDIDWVCVVFTDEYKECIKRWCIEYRISKFRGAAVAGMPELESAYNGLKSIS